MAALSLSTPLAARQQFNQWIRGAELHVDEKSARRGPVIRFMDELFKQLTDGSGVGDLEFLAFDQAQVQPDNGYNIVDGAHRVYAVVAFKGNDATASYLRLSDDATNDGTAADHRATVPFNEQNHSAVLIFPEGLSMAAGMVVSSLTAGTGTTNSTAAADAMSGFVLLGTAA